MLAGPTRAGPSTLRHALKQRTRALHDALDQSLGQTSLDPQGYATFLSVQYAARAPIERWAGQFLVPALSAPPTAALIAADLAELDTPLPATVPFAFPADADPIGLAWALGGSSMGNRAMLAARRKAGFATAERFLSDPASAAFFRALLPRLAEPHPQDKTDAAVLAAEAVFRTFLSALDAHNLKAAA